METPVEQLMRSPRLPLYVQHLQALLQQERCKREQFYRDVSEAQNAEFINDEIIIHAPVGLRHSLASDNFFAPLSAYVKHHDLGLVDHEKLLVALTRNNYEPEVCYFSREKAAQFQPDQVKFPAPDFIAEILSPSTEAMDRGIKFEDPDSSGSRPPQEPARSSAVPWVTPVSLQ